MADAEAMKLVASLTRECEALGRRIRQGHEVRATRLLIAKFNEVNGLRLELMDRLGTLPPGATI